MTFAFVIYELTAEISIRRPNHLSALVSGCATVDTDPREVARFGSEAAAAAAFADYTASVRFTSAWGGGDLAHVTEYSLAKLGFDDDGDEVEFESLDLCPFFTDFTYGDSDYVWNGYRWEETDAEENEDDD